MAQRIKIINPLVFPEWDSFVLATGKCSFFHSSAWARVLSETYGYKPLYFSIIDGHRLLAMVPIMEVESFLTGKRGVSLPFSDHCELIWNGKDEIEKLIKTIIDYGRGNGWKYLELKPGRRIKNDLQASTLYLSHKLDITKKEDLLFAGLRDSTKRNIKKALQAGVECSVNYSLEAIEQFYALNCMTRKHHGIPPQPFKFFKNVYKHIVSKKQGTVILASHADKVVAGAVYFHFGKGVLYKYGASDRAHQNLRANYLVMWNAIQWYCRNDYELFDMGRTESDNKGLNQFKTGWNTQPEEIVYYKYYMKEQSFMPDRDQSSSPMTDRIMPYLPTTILRLIGNVAYRHVA